MTNRDDVVTNRDDVVTNRDDVVTNRHEVVMTFWRFVTNRFGEWFSGEEGNLESPSARRHGVLRSIPEH